MVLLVCRGLFVGLLLFCCGLVVFGTLVSGFLLLGLVVLLLSCHWSLFWLRLSFVSLWSGLYLGGLGDATISAVFEDGFVSVDVIVVVFIGFCCFCMSCIFQLIVFR